MKIELAELNPSDARRFMDTLVIENIEFSFHLVAEIARALVADGEIKAEDMVHRNSLSTRRSLALPTARPVHFRE